MLWLRYFAIFFLLLPAFACPKKPEVKPQKKVQKKEDILAKVEKLKFEEVKETVVADPYIMFNLGLRKEARGELEEAKKFYSYAVELKPSFPEAWINLAWVEWKLGNKEGMIDVMEKAVEVNSSDPRIWATLALAYAEAGKIDEAEKKIRWALENLGLSKELAISMGYNLVKQEKLQLAYFVFDELKRKYPWDPNVLSMSGYVLFRLGYCDEAIADFSKAVTLSPDPKIYTNMGVCYFKQNRIDEAQESFMKAIELEPSFWKAHFNLANIYRRRGMWEEAEKHYLSSITGAEKEGKKAVVLLSLANLYETMASYNSFQPAKALKYLERTRQKLLEVIKEVEMSGNQNLPFQVDTLKKRIAKIEKEMAKLKKKLERELKKKKK